VDIGQWKGVTYLRSRRGDPAPTLHAALSHATAAVALNTAAALEAGILGKPVFTIVTRETAPAQTGTRYFDYLLEENGGHVTVAHDFGTHIHQLAEAIATPRDQVKIRSYVDEFVRPGAASMPAAERMADAIERLSPEKQKSRTSAVFICIHDKLRKQCGQALGNFEHLGGQ
jgi:hypothetical protein